MLRRRRFSGGEQLSKSRWQAALGPWAAVIVLGLAGCGSSPAANAGPGTGCGQQRTTGTYTIGLRTGSCPAHGGVRTSLTITVRDAGGLAVSGANVTVTTMMPSMNMSGTAQTAKPQGVGRYRADLVLGMAGNWDVMVSITPSGGKPVDAHFTVAAK